MKKIITAILLMSSLHSFSQSKNKVITIGMDAPELSFNNPKDKTISLKSLNKNRYILVDFWASWCGPCRRANPTLVEFYKKYEDKNFKDAKKGFEILSVSLDKNKEAWLAAIAKDSLYWNNHMSDLKGWASEAAQIYGVEFIPQAFLISPEGKVIGSYITADEAIPDIQKYVIPGKKKKSWWPF